MLEKTLTHTKAYIYKASGIITVSGVKYFNLRGGVVKLRSETRTDKQSMCQVKRMYQTD